MWQPHVLGSGLLFGKVVYSGLLWPGPSPLWVSFFPLCRGDRSTYLIDCWGDSTGDWPVAWLTEGAKSMLVPVTMHPGDTTHLCVHAHTHTHTHTHTHLCTPAYLLSTVKTPKVKQSQQEFWAQKVCLPSWSNTHPSSHENYVHLTPHSSLRDPHGFIQTAGQAVAAVRHKNGPVWTAWSPPSLWVPGCPRLGLTSKSHFLHWAARTAGSKVKLPPQLRSWNWVLLHYSLAVG